jgi:hypothetical protein
MRKDADYQIDTRVVCSYQTDIKQLKNVLQSFEEFLKNEALLTDIHE